MDNDVIIQELKRLKEENEKIKLQLLSQSSPIGKSGFCSSPDGSTPILSNSQLRQQAIMLNTQGQTLKKDPEIKKSYGFC